mgnify:FL=1
MRISAARVNLGDNRLDDAILKDYGETLVTANTSTSYTIDISTGNAFSLIMTGNCTFTFSNPKATGTACSFTLILQQDGTGSRTATWPAAVKWPAATAPTLTTTASRFDVLTFLTVDGGTRYFGFTAAQNFA